MIKWIKEVSTVLPREYKNVLLFNTLTGLRPVEAQLSLYLLGTKRKDYLENGKGLLKHYQIPDVFFRHTKNAYISIIDKNILEIA
jgi:hypothetical protein